MAEVKMTKRIILEAVKGFMETGDDDREVGVVDEVSVTAADVIAYVDTTLAQMDAKASKAAERAAEKRAKGDELQGVIAEMLSEDPITADEIVARIGDEEITKSRVVARVTNLIKAGRAAKTEVKTEAGNKRVAYTLPVAE